MKFLFLLVSPVPSIHTHQPLKNLQAMLGKTGLFFLFLFFASPSIAQQDTIKISGFAFPTCFCDGFIDITVTGSGPSQPPNAYAYTWSDGSTTQDLFNLCPGSYCVTVMNANSNSTPAVECFFVEPIPFTPVEILSSNTAPCNTDTSGISNTCEKVCPNTTVTYSVTFNTSGGTNPPFISWFVDGAISWVDNGGGGFPYTASVTVNWGGPGTGSVRVFADAAQGCGGEDALCVTIIDEPKAAFESSPAATIAGGPLQVCLGQTVHFRNLSTGDSEYFEWLFSDDLSSTSETNAQHTYLIPGTHTVRLIASSGCLCSDTTTMTVEVIDAQAPTLECVATVCPGATVTYTASNGCAPFSWVVSAEGTVLNGGTPDSDTISVQWNNGPSGSITLGAAPCSGAACPVAGVIEIPIVTGNAPIRGQERVCPGSREVYTIEPFGGTGFVWSLPTGGMIVDGQGTNRVTVQWNTWPNPAPSAAHALSVQYDNCYLGCGGSSVFNVRILSAFRIDGPIEICADASGNFTSKLNFNDAPILCNWTLTAPDGSIAWNSAGAIATPNIPFLSGPGVYRIHAIPADPNSTCSDDADWAVSVRALPAEPAGILGETHICPGTTYTYEASGLPAGSNFRWTVNNGPGAPQIMNGNPLNVNWGATGPYWLSVAQVSRDGLGCLSDTVGLVMSAITPPTINGTSVVCEDSKGIYSTPNLQNVDIQWIITPNTAGSVASGQGENQIEIFWNQPGNHTVNVAICNQNATFPVNVLANPIPVVQHPIGLCPGETATVQTAASYASYVWKNNAGNTVGTGATVVLANGTYSLEVIDADGCEGTSRFSIKNWDAPAVSLTTADPTGFCNNSYTVSLTALTNTDGNYTYEWFRDGNPIAGATGAVLFSNQYGQHTVQATNSYGCTANAGPILLFEYCGGGSGGNGLCTGGALCPPNVVQCVPDLTPRCDSFAMVLNDYTGMYVPGSAVWTTGVSGGQIVGTATGDNPSFVYPNAGKYVVVVLVQLSDGSTCEALDSLNVEAVARFDELPGCSGSGSDFENRSEVLPNISITDYGWDFGDPASGAANNSSMEDPIHVFANAGMYTATLTVTASSGCTSSASRLVDVPDSTPPVFADPASTCAGNALEFVASPNPDILELIWDFGDPASGAANDATGDTVYHSFDPGTYTVIATSVNVYGCSASLTRSITVQASTLSGNVSPASPAPICAGSSLTLSAPTGAVSYLWSDSSSTTSASLTVAVEGSYRVTLTDANGCTYAPPAVAVDITPAPDALIKALIFNDLGQIIGSETQTITQCEGEDLALQGLSNGAGNYTWSGSNGSNQVLYFTDARNSLLPVGTHLYSVTVTSSSTGCTAVSDPFLVTINPNPSGFFISSPTICAGTANVITYNGPTPANWQFFWSNGVSGTNLTTEQSGNYYIRAINEFGCETKSNVHTILPGPPVSSIPAGCHTRCSPDTICLPNLPDITSWQWFLDGNPIPGATSSTFIAQQSGTYWAELTDINGCEAESDPLSLSLFTGYGNVLGQVWSDVNNNGVIDAADTLVSGITVVVYQSGSLFGSAISGASGDFALTNVLSTDYSFSVDPFSLPPNWSIVLGQDQTTLSGCDVSENVEFLLRFGCQAFGTLELTACPGSFATYNGTNISVGGSQIFKLTSLQGCDSTLVVNVSALTTSTNTLSLSACPGGSASYNGTNIPVGTSQDFTLTNAVGCDSVVTVTVSALSPSTSSLSLSACPGGSANYNGTNIPVGTSQDFTLTNAVGCDSVVTVTVSALSPSTSALSLSACPGGSANYNGTNIPVGTSQDFTLSNAVGCDSVVTVTVSALSPSTSALSLSACPGGSANYNGTNIPVGTSQDFTLTNAVGCDSVVTVTVTALSPSTSSLSLSACPGGSANYNGTNIPVGTSQNFTLTNAVGCDSVVTVIVLGDLSPTSAAFSVGVCPGETYVYEGMTLTAGSVQSFNLTNFAGCDSVVTVTVFQKNISSNVLEVNICPGEVYMFQGETIAAGDSREFHFLNSESCDSTLTIFVTSFPETVFELSTDVSCNNSPTGALEATAVSGGPGPFRYSINAVDYQDTARFENLAAGTYKLFVEDANGCIAERDTVLTAIPKLNVELSNAILPCDSAGVQLDALVLGGDAGTMVFNWWNGEQSASSIATEAGTIWVEVSDQCETVRREASVQWAALAEDLDIVYIPNVFMPSARDAANATFKPFFASGITLLSFDFAVYDRWGDQLFVTSDTADAWEGLFRDKSFNPGVLVWHLQADVAICGRVLRVERKGDVTVVR
jgi:PKD repeat protein